MPSLHGSTMRLERHSRKTLANSAHQALRTISSTSSLAPARYRLVRLVTLSPAVLPMQLWLTSPRKPFSLTLQSGLHRRLSMPQSRLSMLRDLTPSSCESLPLMGVRMSFMMNGCVPTLSTRTAIAFPSIPLTSFHGSTSRSISFLSSLSKKRLISFFGSTRIVRMSNIMALTSGGFGKSRVLRSKESIGM